MTYNLVRSVILCSTLGVNSLVAGHTLTVPYEGDRNILSGEVLTLRAGNLNTKGLSVDYALYINDVKVGLIEEVVPREMRTIYVKLKGDINEVKKICTVSQPTTDNKQGHIITRVCTSINYFVW